MSDGWLTWSTVPQKLLHLIYTEALVQVLYAVLGLFKPTSRTDQCFEVAFLD